MPPRITVPLFIVCAYAPCGKVHPVRNRHDQQRIKHCSHACASAATAHTRRDACRDACRQVGLAWARTRRQRLLVRVQGLSPLAAFRLGYLRGLASKHRQIRRQKAAAA